jgi:hypothetical protein
MLVANCKCKLLQWVYEIRDREKYQQTPSRLE